MKRTAHQVPADAAAGKTVVGLNPGRVYESKAWPEDHFVRLAGEVENADRSADDLAMGRDVWDFRNLLLVEQPNGDFGQTIMRHFLFDLWHVPMLSGLESSASPRIAEIAAKAGKEAAYHLERSRETVVALGDGTPESHARMQNALNILWPYVGEMFAPDATDTAMAKAGISPDISLLRPEFDDKVRTVMAEATLDLPDGDFHHKGGKSGFQHSENLGHMLTQMQWLQRAYPNASW